jgi:hypothetical protein
LHKFGELVSEDFQADMMPQPVVQDIPPDGCKEEHQYQPGEGEETRGCTGPGHKKERIPGHKNGDDAPGLEQYDQKEDDIGAVTEIGDEVREILVNVQQKIQHTGTLPWYCTLETGLYEEIPGVPTGSMRSFIANPAKNV